MLFRLTRIMLVSSLCWACGTDQGHLPRRSDSSFGGAPDQAGDGPVDEGGKGGEGGEGGLGIGDGQAGVAASVGGATVASEPDREPPRLLASVPSDGDDNVAWTVSPRLSFSEPVMFSEGALALRQLQPARLIPLSSMLAADQRTIELVLQEIPDAPSELVLELSAGITDLAGNALEPIALHFAVPLWMRLGASLNRDASVAATDARLARDGAGRLVMLSVEGGDVYASRYQSGAWQPLGAALNVGATQPSPAAEPRIALTIDGSNAPLAGFRENGAVVVRRWDGSAWQHLGGTADPDGTGSYAPALSLGDSGQPVVAFDALEAGLQPSLRVQTLVQGTWQTLAELNDVSRGVRLAGDGQQPFTLAYRQAPAGIAAMRWADNRLEALGGGSALQTASSGFALSVNAAQGVVLSADGQGSAQLAGNAWPALEPDLGFLLSSAALDRSLFHAADGSLLAAFSEPPNNRSAARVYVQRLAQGRFMPLGPALNRDPEAAATQPSLTAGEEGEPIVAFLETPEGGSTQLYAARYNGDPSQPPTGLQELKHDAACLAQAPLDGSRLLDTDCFADEIGRTPLAGFIPFDVASPLWSDGASKRRFFMLPEGKSITYRDPGIWTFPPGSILIKEFAIEGRRGDPASLRPVETRFLVVRATGNWERYSYQWNQAATEAVLRPDVPPTSLGTYAIEDEQGAPAQQNHFFPSRAQCLSCHEAPGTVLGPQTGMFNRNIDYGTTVDNQLRSLAQLGVFGSSFASTSLASASFMPSPSDTSYTTEARLRSFLHANCSSCHHPLEGLDLRLQIPTLASGLCSKLQKGNLEGSLIYWRDVRRGNVGQPDVAPMPPLGTLGPSPLIEPLLTDWILSPQNPCP